MIRPHHLRNASEYPAYRELLQKLLAEGKTTGHDQSETLLNYARVNFQRMTRVEKTVSLTPKLLHALSCVNQSYTWLVITEGWCGDTAQIIPVLNAICNATPNIRLMLLLRDDNPDVMEQYLTNGARSIPKLICLEKESLRELFTWGPRPAPLQALVMQMVKDSVPKDEKGLIVQKWYNADQGVTTQAEIAALVTRHMCQR